jgi:hypothetical protein
MNSSTTMPFSQCSPAALAAGTRAMDAELRKGAEAEQRSAKRIAAASS